MLARYHFLLPCLHLSLFREGIRFQHAVYNAWELAATLVNVVDLAFEAFDTSRGVITI